MLTASHGHDRSRMGACRKNQSLWCPRPAGICYTHHTEQSSEKVQRSVVPSRDRDAQREIDSMPRTSGWVFVAFLPSKGRLNPSAIRPRATPQRLGPPGAPVRLSRDHNVRHTSSTWTPRTSYQLTLSSSLKSDRDSIEMLVDPECSGSALTWNSSGQNRCTASLVAPQRPPFVMDQPVIS
jgi:hypothetical protein